jgi:hypothetical protein
LHLIFIIALPCGEGLLAKICALFRQSLSLVLLLWFLYAIGGRSSALPLLELFSCICGGLILVRGGLSYYCLD